MAGERRFRSALFGFNKVDVNSYIEKLLKEFEERLRRKDDEITILRAHTRDLKMRLENGVSSKPAPVHNDEKSKIADVLIRAQENAELIINEAKGKAEQEQKRLQQMIEQEKERLVDIKEDIRILKSELVRVLKKYEDSLNAFVGEE